MEELCTLSPSPPLFSLPWPSPPFSFNSSVSLVQSTVEQNLPVPYCALESGVVIQPQEASFLPWKGLPSGG